MKKLKLNLEYTSNDKGKEDNKKTSKTGRILEGIFISLVSSLVVLFIKILFGL